jgi:hypothetical protein
LIGKEIAMTTTDTPPPARPAPASGLLLRIEPMFSARRRFSPDNDGNDGLHKGYGPAMTHWLSQLTARR